MMTKRQNQSPICHDVLNSNERSNRNVLFTRSNSFHRPSQSLTFSFGVLFFPSRAISTLLIDMLLPRPRQGGFTVKGWSALVREKICLIYTKSHSHGAE